MRHPLLVFSALLLAIGQTACAHAPSLAPVAQTREAGLAGARSVPGRLVVQWKHPERAAALLAKLGASSAERLDELDTDVVALPSGMDETAFKAALGDAAEAAEPDYVVRAFGAADPLQKSQYALGKVNAAGAWAVTTGGERTRIAIIDTGVDADHPDLRGQVVGQANTIGWRGKLGVGSARDENGHGTHCAGIAAAVAGNGEGIAGMAPGCKLLAAKALGRDGTGASSDIAKAIQWAVNQRADVISMSIGCPDDAVALRSAVKNALARGVVVVAAMGNEGKTLKNYPAAYPGVIAVGATTNQDRVASYSTRGNWISVSAPGSGILSTMPTYRVFLNGAEAGGVKADYDKMSGTSMATPLVAGVAALIKTKHPDWSPAQVKSVIESTAAKVDGPFSSVGHGRIDAAAALRR